MEKVKLGDVTINLDRKRKPLNWSDREKISIKKKYPYCGANDIMDYVDEYLFDEEILCIAEDGGKWGHNERCSYIMNEKCWINNHAHVIKTTEKIDIRYLKYWLNYNDLNPIITGTIVRKLTQKALNNIDILLPTKNKQIIIANNLDKVKEIIDIRKKQIKQLDELIKSQFVEMFGDVINNQKHFDYKRIDEISEIVTGTTPSTEDTSNWNGNIKWITPAEIDKNTFIINDTERKITEKGRKSKSLIVMPKGTVLFTTRAPIGKTAITGDFMCCNQGFKNCICKKDINNIYLYFVLKYNANYFDCLGTGATFRELSKTNFSKIQISIPPIELQNKFADFVKQIDKQKFELQKSLEAMEKLQESLMDKYFGG